MTDKPLSLYELGIEGLEITRILQENEGELSPELEARINELMIAGPDRVEAGAMVVRSMEASAAACEAEVERLAKRAKAFQESANRLKGYIAMALDTVFGGKVKTNRFTLYTQQAPDHVEFDIQDGYSILEIESKYPSLVRVKRELNKVELKERFSAGDPLPTANRFTKTPGKRSIRIK